MSKYLELVSKLQLHPHPEGGFYKETYRSEQLLNKSALGNEFSGDRNYSTGIYFLLTKDNFSAFHRIKQDEMWHFYMGDPLLVHEIDQNGRYTCHELGNDFSANQLPQLVISAGSWFGSSVIKTGDFSLVGCTVAPGFDFDDFELAKRDELTALYPVHQDIIKKLTRL